PRGIGGPGLLSRGTVGGPEPKVADEGLRKERLIRDHPRGLHLGVIHGAEIAPERAVVIGAQGAREEQAILVPEHLLDVGAQRYRLRRRLAAVADRAAADGLTTRWQPGPARRDGEVELLQELNAPRRLGADRRRDR